MHQKDPKSRLVVYLGKDLCECTKKDSSKFNSGLSTTFDKGDVETFIVISCSECPANKRISLGFTLIEVFNPPPEKEVAAKDSAPPTTGAPAEPESEQELTPFSDADLEKLRYIETWQPPKK